MISLLRLKCFKCFKELDLPVAPLTVLSGTNASGKSSIIQSLVLLHQTMRDHEWSKRLVLNGYALRLGTVTDVVDKVYGQRAIDIGVVDDGVSCTWTLTGERDDMSMEVASVRVEGKPYARPQVLRRLLPPGAAKHCEPLSLHLRDLMYISSERLGPREVYPLEDMQSAAVVGRTGEYVTSVLVRRDDGLVRSRIASPDAIVTLRHQVAARMQEFFPGFEMDYQKVAEVNAVTLGLRNSSDTSYHRAVNIGYGVTQVLPIVVAGLTCEADGILLIENPEVHLHPSAQSRMGQFIAEVVRSGVQVIVETHSDHVLNGVRRSVKDCQLSASDVAIHFFTPRSEGVAQVTSPGINANGDIETWPAGFFDQFDKDMSYFAGWGV